MTEYMYLIGAEQVQNAAYTIRDAAERLNQAANSIEWPLRQALDRFELLVVRFEEAAAKLAITPTPQEPK